MTYRLKTWPVYYSLVVSGKKQFEVRKDDRAQKFALGDILVLEEYDPTSQSYTGASATFEVTSVMKGPRFGIEDGYCAMGIAPCPEELQRMSRNEFVTAENYKRLHDCLMDRDRWRVWHELRAFLLLRGVEFVEKTGPHPSDLEITKPRMAMPGFSITIKVGPSGAVTVEFKMNEVFTAHKLYQPNSVFEAIEFWTRFEAGSNACGAKPKSAQP